jgi:hypothetical protein
MPQKLYNFLTNRQASRSVRRRRPCFVPRLSRASRKRVGRVFYRSESTSSNRYVWWLTGNDGIEQREWRKLTGCLHTPLKHDSACEKGKSSQAAWAVWLHPEKRKKE